MANSKQASQKAKRAMPAPRRLAELIQLVNLLPPGGTDLREMYERVASDHTEVESLELNKIFLEEFEGYVGTLAPEVQRFIGPPRDPQDSSAFNIVAARRYDLLIESQDLFIQITSANNAAYHHLRAHSRKINEESLKELWTSQNMSGLILFLRMTPMELIRNKEGRIEGRANILFEAMQTAAHLRIRHCLICNSYFWAGRIDQPCCSARCANALRSRRNRRNRAKLSRKSEARYLGDLGTKLIHDLEHTKPGCRLQSIIEQSQEFHSLDQALKKRFQPCLYCIGNKTKGEKE
jgi:hypothetical protein